MVNPGRRMNKLQVLLDLRHGPGAAVLPPEITRIHLDFARKWTQGHFGPRKFWRKHLPRLKYWNPVVPMLVNRFDDQEAPATMSIYYRKTFASRDPASTIEAVRNMLPLAQQPCSGIRDEHPAPEPAEDERVLKIDMSNIHSDNILKTFLEKTGATPVQPTPDEEALMRQIQERRERGAVDRTIVKKYIDDKRHEEQMLAVARQEADAIKAANQ
ncbi:CI-B8 domain-containing protein [Ustulina deusta]|nr:CI-B8 domain-containing protein [Ustulina deusta]